MHTDAALPRPQSLLLSRTIISPLSRSIPACRVLEWCRPSMLLPSAILTTGMLTRHTSPARPTLLSCTRHITTLSNRNSRLLRWEVTPVKHPILRQGTQGTQEIQGILTGHICLRLLRSTPHIRQHHQLHVSANVIQSGYHHSSVLCSHPHYMVNNNSSSRLGCLRRSRPLLSLLSQRNRLGVPSMVVCRCRPNHRSNSILPGSPLLLRLSRNTSIRLATCVAILLVRLGSTLPLMMCPARLWRPITGQPGPSAEVPGQV